MIRVGDMVRYGGGPPMRADVVFHDMVRCLFVDSHGVVRQRFYLAEQLTPLWLSLQPRSCWPERGNLDMLELAEEEKRAAAEKKAAKKQARKARASSKIKRRAA